MLNRGISQVGRIARDSPTDEVVVRMEAEWAVARGELLAIRGAAGGVQRVNYAILDRIRVRKSSGKTLEVQHARAVEQFRCDD